MSLWARLFSRRKRMMEALDQDIRDYIERETQDNIERGVAPKEAHYAALRKFGNVTRVKEDAWDVWSFVWLEQLWQDVRYGVRMLAKSPGFTAVAALTIALGIGATAAMFTVVNAVLLRPLPYPHPEELVYVQEVLGNFGVLPYAWNREYVAWRNQSKTLVEIAEYMYTSFNLTGGGEAERVNSGMASPSFFSLLGVRPLVGRLFLPQEDHPGAPPVVILSEALWKRRSGADRSVIGKGINLDGKLYTVVGVLPSTFMIPDQMNIEYALWVPLIATGTGRESFSTVRVIGRLKRGVSLATACSELDTILQSSLPKGFGLKKSVVLSPWHDQVVEHSRNLLLLFFGAVGLLLLIACVNVANLLLSRAVTRQKEIAVRLSVGAGKVRIIRQLLSESVLLALLGGLLGLGLARVGKNVLVRLISPNLPALEPITLDYRVLGFCLALAVLTGLAFGLAPALQATKVSLNETLKEAGRSGAESRSGKLFRNLLIVCETALAMVLLVGAGLLFRSFLRVRGVDPGFRSTNVLSLTIDLTPADYPTPTKQAMFFKQVIEGIKGIEGVQLVGGSGCPPLGNRMDAVHGSVVVGLAEDVPINFATASPDYFRAMGIPLLRGRYFDDGDHDGSLSVAIVNECFARRFFPHEDCLGRKLRSWTRENDWLSVVGVVGDIRAGFVETAPSPEIYVPYLQAGEPYMTLLVRPSVRGSGRWPRTSRCTMSRAWMKFGKGLLHQGGSACFCSARLQHWA
jgi:predicted permease